MSPTSRLSQSREAKKRYGTRKATGLGSNRQRLSGDGRALYEEWRRSAPKSALQRPQADQHPPPSRADGGRFKDAARGDGAGQIVVNDLFK